MVKLSARSGRGKSSILEAVAWGLFGKTTGVTSWNSTKCAVSMGGFGLEVERKRPNQLLVGGASGKEAQALIEATLGMNESEFMASSYVIQMQENSLINLSPSEQLEMIFALSFKGKDPESMKEKIREVLKGLDKQITQKDVERQLEEKDLKSIEDQIALVLESFNPEHDHYQLGSLEEAKAEVARLRAVKADLEKQANHPSRTRYSAAEEFIKLYTPALEAKHLWLEDVANKPVLFSVTDKQKEISKLAVARAEIVQKIELNRKLVEMGKNKQLLSQTYEDNWGRLSDEALEVKKDVKDANLAQGLKLKAEAFLATHEALRRHNAPEATGDHEATLLAEIKAIDEQSKSLNEETLRLQMHNGKYQECDKECASLKERLDKALTVIEGFATLMSDEVLAQKVAQNTEALSQADSYQKWCFYQEKYLTLDEAKRNKEVALVSVKTEVEGLLGKVERYNLLLAVVNKAALDSIEKTINDINIRAEYWLEKMFNGEMQAAIKTSKKLKSKDETVDKLHLEIMLKGNEVSSKNELSGGERSRLSLCYQLALSDLYNSPVLLLDESLRGVDAETLETCLDAIREISTRKLVLLIEHFAPNSQFDHVVTL